jgi:uncharacterized protein with NRDE domain
VCLLVLAWRVHPRYRLVLAANRDEFHDRAAAPLAPWPLPQRLLAGRDLKAGGTWLALDAARRFGVVTNYREAQRPRPAAPSRGDLIPHFLSGAERAADYLAHLSATASAYSGFNLLLGDAASLWYGSNRGTPFARELSAGVHGLSNELLDTPWPKLLRVRRAFEAWLAAPASAQSVGALFAMLADRTQSVAASELQQSGLPAELERVLSAPFVLHPVYGTRCSSVLLLGNDGAVTFIERRFDAHGAASGESEFRLNAAEWP